MGGAVVSSVGRAGGSISAITWGTWDGVAVFVVLSSSMVPVIVISEVSLLFPRYIEGGRVALIDGDFLGSNRLKSDEEEPFVGISANIVSRTTEVEAEDFRGHVPYQLSLGLSYTAKSI